MIPQIIAGIAFSAEKIPLLDAMFNETLRLRGPVPAMVLDSNGSNVKIDGIDLNIWKGMHVFCLFRLVATSER